MFKKKQKNVKKYDCINAVCCSEDDIRWSYLNGKWVQNPNRYYNTLNATRRYLNEIKGITSRYTYFSR